MNTITTKRLAAKLGVSTRSVWRFHHDMPDFPRAIKLGHRSVLWDEDQIDAWLRSRQQVKEPQHDGSR